MSSRNLSVVILSGLLALWPMAPTVVAQPSQPAEKSQVEALTDSIKYQRWWWQFQQRAYPLGYR